MQVLVHATESRNNEMIANAHSRRIGPTRLFFQIGLVIIGFLDGRLNGRLNLARLV